MRKLVPLNFKLRNSKILMSLFSSYILKKLFKKFLTVLTFQIHILKKYFKNLKSLKVVPFLFRLYTQKYSKIQSFKALAFSLYFFKNSKKFEYLLSIFYRIFKKF